MNIEAELSELNNRVADASSRGDYEAVAAHYTEDAVFLAPDRAIARGREAVRDLYADLGSRPFRRRSEQAGHFACQDC